MEAESPSVCPVTRSPSHHSGTTLHSRSSGCISVRFCPLVFAPIITFFTGVLDTSPWQAQTPTVSLNTIKSIMSPSGWLLLVVPSCCARVKTMLIPAKSNPTSAFPPCSGSLPIPGTRLPQRLALLSGLSLCSPSCLVLPSQIFLGCGLLIFQIQLGVSSPEGASSWTSPPTSSLKVSNDHLLLPPIAMCRFLQDGET